LPLSKRMSLAIDRLIDEGGSADPLQALIRLVREARFNPKRPSWELADTLYELFKDKGWLTKEAIALCEEEEES